MRRTRPIEAPARLAPRLFQEAERARNLAIVGYAVAGALVATSVVLFVKGSTRSERQVACAAAPSPWTVTCLLRF